MIMMELREQTKDLHRRTETSVDLMKRLHSKEAYVQLLSRFHGFYLPLEDRISSVLASEIPGLNLEERTKAHLLVIDLIALGKSEDEIASMPICDQLRPTNSIGHALGCLYVLEGSALGGQFIRREVERRLGFTSEQGCRFFTGQGDLTASAWRAFCNTLDSYADEHPHTQNNILFAAEETFKRFGEWVSC